MSRLRVQYKVTQSHNITASKFAHMDGGAEKKVHVYFLSNTHGQRHMNTQIHLLCLLCNEVQVSIIYPDLKYSAKITAL